MKIRLTLLIFFLACWASLSVLSAQDDTLILPPSIEVDEEAAEEVFDEDAVEAPFQNASAYSLPIDQAPLREVPADRWQRAMEGHYYADDVPEPPKAQAPPQQNPGSAPNLPQFDWDTNAIKTTFQVIGIVLLLGLAVWLLYNMSVSPSNSLIRAEDGTVITFDNLDAYINETDLQRFLREALARGDYNQAIRVYYLQVIKDLSQKKAIQWTRDKTNREYLREMRNHPESAGFRQTTRIYEDVWYGNGILDESSYQRLAARFDGFLAKI